MVIRETVKSKDWDLDLRAELYKQEFLATHAWASEREGMVLPWSASITSELRQLRHLKDERPAHIGDIVQEQQASVLIGYWFGLLAISRKTHPLTTELLHATLSLAGSVATCVKVQFNRVRPWVVAPDLAPPIPSPGLPSYPSGHSTQMHLMAATLLELAPARSTEIKKIVSDVTLNRERAGLNYPSDTKAGELLAGRIFGILMKECTRFREVLEQAKVTERPEIVRSQESPKSRARSRRTR